MFRNHAGELWWVRAIYPGPLMPKPGIRRNFVWSTRSRSSFELNSNAAIRTPFNQCSPYGFAYPEQMLAAMRESLKPDGVIALAEYRWEDPAVPIKILHKMSKEQILKEYLPNGFKLVREFDKLPWQHLMFFGRP